MRSTTSPATFKYVFSAVLCMTLTSGGAAFHLAGQPALTDSQDRILDSAIAMWTMGTTTLIGLLSTHSSDPKDRDGRNA